MTGWKAATKGTSCFYSISSYEERQKPHLFIHSLSLSLSLSLSPCLGLSICVYCRIWSWLADWYAAWCRYLSDGIFVMLPAKDCVREWWIGKRGGKEGLIKQCFWLKDDISRNWHTHKWFLMKTEQTHETNGSIIASQVIKLQGGEKKCMVLVEGEEDDDLLFDTNKSSTKQIVNTAISLYLSYILCNL